MVTPRENFIHALQRKTPKGRVPTFELVFYLTMEAFGKLHPSQRYYQQWGQMTQKERNCHHDDIGFLQWLLFQRF